MYNDSYITSLLEQRAQRAQSLLGDASWLTLAGLFWLQIGENGFGSATSNPIVLPAHSAPTQAGILHFYAGETTIEAAPGVTLQINEQPMHSALLKPDSTGAPDWVTLGDLTFLVIQRGQRFGIRLYDKRNPAREQFTGLRWYPISGVHRIEAQFVAYEPPKTIAFGSSIGDESQVASPGYACFEWQGQECRLDAQPAKSGLFFNFRDQTNGDTTYPAGRFLYTEAPQNERVIVDFNQATNPYCAYTAYATCPLPPAQNHLPVRIEAGEMKYGD